MTAIAKVFMNGRSQAVRLPKEFRFDSTEVRVSRDGNRVILEPIISAEADIAAVFARIDALRDGEDLFDVADAAEQPSEEDVRAWFDA
jgi:antitoxin VapB